MLHDEKLYEEKLQKRLQSDTMTFGTRVCTVLILFCDATLCIAERSTSKHRSQWCNQ